MATGRVRADPVPEPSSDLAPGVRSRPEQLLDDRRHSGGPARCAPAGGGPYAGRSRPTGGPIAREDGSVSAGSRGSRDRRTRRA